MKYFFDTSILIYAFDTTDKVKNKKAKELIELHLKNNTLVVSSQVVQEFSNAALRKFSPQLSVAELSQFTQQLLLPNCRLYPTPAFYTDALRLYQVNSLSYYDSLIVQAAIDSGCKVLYSEDLSHGQQFGSVTVTNPFKD